MIEMPSLISRTESIIQLFERDKARICTIQMLAKCYGTELQMQNYECDCLSMSDSRAQIVPLQGSLELEFLKTKQFEKKK